MFTAGKKDFKEHWALNYSRYPASVEGMKWTELKTRVSGGKYKNGGRQSGNILWIPKFRFSSYLFQIDVEEQIQSADCIISYITWELPPRGLPLVEIPDKRVSLSGWFQVWRAILALVDALHTACKHQGVSEYHQS